MLGIKQRNTNPGRPYRFSAKMGIFNKFRRVMDSNKPYLHNLHIRATNSDNMVQGSGEKRGVCRGTLNSYRGYCYTSLSRWKCKRGKYAHLPGSTNRNNDTVRPYGKRCALGKTSWKRVMVKHCKHQYYLFRNSRLRRYLGIQGTGSKW
jgi:hypothetical protein